MNWKPDLQQRHFTGSVEDGAILLNSQLIYVHSIHSLPKTVCQHAIDAMLCDYRCLLLWHFLHFQEV